MLGTAWQFGRRAWVPSTDATVEPGRCVVRWTRSDQHGGRRDVTFEEFLAQRLEPLLRYATVVTCDPHLAEDVVQEVMIRVQGRWQRISAMDAPERYVQRMVVNEFLSWRRRRATTSTVLVDPTALGRVVSSMHDPLGEAAEHGVDDRDYLLRLIASLPPRQRAVIALRYHEDLGDTQIADLLGCRPATVRSLAFRALATLRRAMPDVSTLPACGETR